MPRAPLRPGRVQAGVWLGLVAAGAAAVAAGVWSGCAVTKENYKTLSFFFDGVPDPAARAASGEPGGVGTPASVVTHRPYAEQNCDACHTTRYRPTRNDSSVCLQCHAGVQTAYQRMHGPVAAAACLWCHSPHESAYPALLRDSDRKVCSQCHTPDLLSSARVAAHADAARGCLECHSGHGGDRPHMLRPGVPEAGAAAIPGKPVPTGDSPGNR